MTSAALKRPARRIVHFIFAPSPHAVTCCGCDVIVLPGVRHWSWTEDGERVRACRECLFRNAQLKELHR